MGAAWVRNINQEVMLVPMFSHRSVVREMAGCKSDPPDFVFELPGEHSFPQNFSTRLSGFLVLEPLTRLFFG